MHSFDDLKDLDESDKELLRAAIKRFIIKPVPIPDPQKLLDFIYSEEADNILAPIHKDSI